MRRTLVEIAGQERWVEVERQADGSVVARIEGDSRTFAASRDVGLLLDDRGRVFRVEALSKNDRWTVTVGNASDVAVVRDGTRHRARLRQPASSAGGEAGAVTSPMPGRVFRVAVRAGERVGPGQPLLVIEAMKMENEIRAAWPGTVRDVAVREGQPVETGERLLTIDP